MKSSKKLQDELSISESIEALVLRIKEMGVEKKKSLILKELQALLLGN